MVVKVFPLGELEMLLFWGVLILTRLFNGVFTHLPFPFEEICQGILLQNAGKDFLVFYLMNSHRSLHNFKVKRRRNLFAESA